MTKLERLEERARKIQNRLDSVRDQWEDEIDRMKQKGTWEKYCDDRGLTKTYTFGDLLC